MTVEIVIIIGASLVLIKTLSNLVRYSAELDATQAKIEVPNIVEETVKTKKTTRKKK